jgi:hypothetical protein
MPHPEVLRLCAARAARAYTRRVGLEALIIVALQFAFELLLEIVLWFPWDMLLLWRHEKGIKLPGAWPIVAGGALLGAMLAAMSLVVVPHTILVLAWARVANLFITPFLCGAAALAMARKRRRRGRAPNASVHFWFALLFSMTFVAIRFAWARRPS